MGQVLQGFDCDVLLSSTPSLALTNEPMNNQGDNITYQIANASHRYLDDAVVPIVQYSVDGLTGWTNLPGGTVYTLLWPIGTVVFAVARSTGVNAFIRMASGNYFSTSSVGDAYGWTLSLMTNKQDVTPFQQLWRSKLVTIKDANAKVQTWRSDALFAGSLAAKMVLILYVDKSVGTRWVGYALLDSNDIKSSATAAFAEDVSFDGQGTFYYQLT